ncbi:hypothetical protein ACHRV1_03890 [Flavobacterium aquidurense]|uniref:hypothetical protein n=1 Tax=Flavobacterium aquidurense TaxID=362413 RepID=UPI0037578625
MKTHKLIAICLMGSIGLIVTSCGKKSADGTEEVKTEKAAESSAGSAATGSDTKKGEVIEIKNFDFLGIPESNASIGEFPYLKEIPDFKVSGDDSKEKDFDRVVVYDGKTFSSIEGRLLYKKGIAEDEKTFSSYKTIKQFESACEKLNATKIYSLSREEYSDALFGGSPDLMSLFPEKEKAYLVARGNNETALYALKKGDKKVLFFLTLDGNSGGNYQLYVVEEGKLDDK